MPITVKIMKRTAEGRPVLYATRDLDVLPASIGRDAACTIALEDPNKHMSRFHVEIAEERGTYWMTVVSKVNPVMAKGRRYGPGTRLTLQSGDTFELAEYEVQVVLPEPKPEPKPAPEPCEATYIPQQARLEPSQPLHAFLEGAGLPHMDVAPAQAERMLRDGGAILRAAMEGIMMLLRARREMRTPDNNPLKRMSDAREAMDFLFDPGERTGGLLDPVQALGNACEELRLHEMALMAGMRAAVMAALRRFEPSAMERRGRKSKLWDLYVAEQAKLVRDVEADFDSVFGADFLSAYQAELRRLKGGR